MVLDLTLTQLVLQISTFWKKVSIHPQLDPALQTLDLSNLTPQNHGSFPPSSSTFNCISNLRPPTFDGENYQMWSIQMRTFFIAQGLWDVVENEYKEPSKDHDNTTNFIHACKP